MSIRLMIVDDEQIVRDGIKYIIDQSFPEQFEVVAMVSSGRRAIEAFETFRPTLILMDIQMPGINGIEAIQAILNMDPNSKFVIISAYEQFEYAKEAVRLGAHDYVLKPIRKQQLVDILGKIYQEIIDEKRHIQQEIEIQEKLDQILPVLESGYIYAIIMNSDYERERINYLNLLGIERDMGYIMVIEFSDEGELRGETNKIGMGVKSTTNYQLIRNAIKFKCQSIVGPLMVNRLVVLVYDELPDNEYDQRVKAITTAEVLHERLSRISQSQVHIALGSAYRFKHMNISYNEAVKTVRQMTDEQILHVMDVVEATEDHTNISKLKADEEILIQYIEEGQVEMTMDYLEAYLNKLERYFGHDADRFKGLLIELMVLAKTIGHRQCGNYQHYDIQYAQVIHEYDQLYDMKHYAYGVVKTIVESVKKSRMDKVSDFMTAAMSYIKNHYNQDLRLKDVAEAVAISPQYFSKVFKKELGVNFIDYLTNVRMETAKTMIKEGKLTIKEICYQIGYNDPNYFSRLFKKVEGMSPSEYS